MPSLEENMEALTKALNENTAELRAARGGAAPAAGAKAAAGTTAAPKAAAAKKKAPSVTAEEIKVLAVKVKEEVGEDDAKALIKKHGGGKLSDLIAKPDAFDAFAAEAQAALDNNGGDAADEEDDEL